MSHPAQRSRDTVILLSYLGPILPVMIMHLFTLRIDIVAQHMYGYYFCKVMTKRD